jgi:uncharacterized protein DUF4292
MESTMKILFLAAIAALLMVACGSTKQVADLGVDKDELNGLPIKTEITNLKIKCKIDIDYKSSRNSANAVIKLAGYDSLSMMITGPFSIPVGKLYANKDHFVFYNALQNEVLEGKPTAANLERAIFLPLDFKDLIKLLRAEPTQTPKDYTKIKSDKEEYLAMSAAVDDEKDEIVYLDPTKKYLKILNWIKEDKKLIEVEYRRYRSHDGQSLPNVQKYVFPEINAKVIIDVSSYSVNDVFDSPFEFSLPSDVKRFSLDK